MIAAPHVITDCIDTLTECKVPLVSPRAGNSDKYEVSERTKVKRIKDRGKYDKVTVHSILDEAFIAHVGFVKDGFPLVLPMGYARDGENLLLHGSITNAMLKNMKVLLFDLFWCKTFVSKTPSLNTIMHGGFSRLPFVRTVLS